MSKLNANVEKLTAHQEDKGKSVVFPAQPEQNPRGQNYNSSASGSGHHKQAKVVTVLRSGRVIENEKRVEEEKEELREEEEGTTDKPNQEEILREDFAEGQSKDEPPQVSLPAPYPQRLRKITQEDKSQDILELFKQVKINLLLLYAIKQVPACGKFLKDMCTVKRK